MIVTLEMYQAAKRMMVCAPAWKCPHEEDCFHLARPIVQAWEAQQRSAALARARKIPQAVSDAPTFPPQVAYEWARPDWDAA